MSIPHDDPNPFKLLLNTLSTHILALSADGTITYINPACQRHFQQISEDLRGANISRLMSPADTVSIKEYFSALIPDQPAGQFEHNFVETNGTIRTQRWDITAVFDQSPQPTAYHCEGQDISHLKQMEKTMTQQENQLKMHHAMEGADKSAILVKICQAMQDALIIIDHFGNIKFWGGGAEQIFGYTESEIIGKDLHAVLAPQRYHAAAYE
ncbi:MAG: PAS domain-containing protein, partial [Candidatus Omnitrophica bacterium]|nr:PAS domain-containing protein [Candidatus Omnitrophota bacterium]